MEAARGALGSIPILSLKHRLLSGSVWALAGKLVTALAMLSANALLARLLSPQDLGAYFLAFSVVQIGALLGSLGLNWTVVRLVAESIGLNRFGRARRAVEKVFVLGLLGALGIAAAYLLFGHVLGNDLFHAPALAAVTGLVAGWIAVMTIQVLLAEVFRGFHDIRFAALFGGLATWALLTVCLGLLWLVKGQATLATIVLLAAGSGLANALLASWFLRRKVAALPAQHGAESHMGFGSILNVAWPLLITNLNVFALTQADLWILGAFRPQEEVAIYGAAAKLVILVAMPLVIVNAVVPPLIAEMYAQGRKRELERVLRAIATLSGIPAFLVLVGFVTLGDPILGLVFGDYYREGATVLALLSVGQLVNVWVGSCGQVLMMTGHQRMMMAITTACGVVTVVVGLMVVDRYGPMGVAVAAAGGLLLQNVSMWVATKVTTGIWTHVGFGDVLELARAARG